MTLSTQTKRIACYALIAKDAGSLASANYLIIEELLIRGYEIDFYALKGFQKVDDFYKYKNFRYISVSARAVQFVWDSLEKMPKNGGVLYTVWAKISTSIYFNLLNTKLSLTHTINPYDIVLVLGLPNFFKLKNVTRISWLQGTFDSEIEVIDKLKWQIISLSGLLEYIKLKLFYSFRNLTSKNIFQSSDVFICCSQWAKARLKRSGLESIEALPYPMDLDYFKPQHTSFRKDEQKIKFLWLGRVVPRKRIDLLLGALAMLIPQYKNIHLTVIGSFAYASGYKQLIDKFQYPDHITYVPKIDRVNVPDLMNSVDILIQPSEAEDFGSSVAEALCCGVPVVVGETNGTKDYIGSYSWVFSEYTVESLYKTMEMAIKAIANNREEIFNNSRLTAEQEFSTIKIVDRLEAIFAKNTTRKIL